MISSRMMSCLLYQATLLLVGGSRSDTKDLRLAESYVDKREFLRARSLESDTVILNMEGAVVEGSFGYEEYEWPCSSEMTAAYGYVLGQCSRGSASSSYVYNWCALSPDNSKIYFHVTEYAGSNCTDVEIYNNTFWDYNTCDAVNSRKSFCKSTTDGWMDYNFDQHVEVFDDQECGGNMNYWKADNIDCLDFCYISSYRESIRGQCDNNPNDWGDDDFCFHSESLIDYKGVQYTLDELKKGKEPECMVPHTPRSRGVVIATSCGLTARVTDTHLMATPEGFRLAYSLKPGDILFSGYGSEEEAMCSVVSVRNEETEQEYFGLNCLHSEVLTSGLRASTFGTIHTLPSWFMAYVGGLLGIETASQLGAYISGIFFSL